MTLSDAPRPALGALLVTISLLGALHARDASAATEEAIACESDGIVRFVSLRSDPDPDRVCDVLMERPDEGVEPRVLWFARNDPDFCEPHFRKVVDNLASKGWRCDRAEAPDENDAGSPRPEAQTQAQTQSRPQSQSQTQPQTQPQTAGTDERFREWCLAGSAGDDGPAGPAEGRYCDCVRDALLSAGMSGNDLDQIVVGIPPQFEVERDGDVSATASKSKRLNSLRLSYEHAAESCR